MSLIRKRSTVSDPVDLDDGDPYPPPWYSGPPPKVTRGPVITAYVDTQALDVDCISCGARAGEFCRHDAEHGGRERKNAMPQTHPHRGASRTHGRQLMTTDNPDQQQPPASFVPDEKRQAAIQSAVEHLTVLNDRLAIFEAVRRIVFADGGSAPADLQAIRQLYEDHDAKYPPKGSGS